ncbi:hypothetical protein M3197_14750 [Sporosarcina aquimarina]|uniref:hypothetical protein n=1 Tax=Sporosarcina aquimarina TaxID=114975 RepID=UPI00203E62A6|nr:hypothetical protein [Sporosarcina aquimarina]MCM3758721.1 hypothetical protein [Sporosarcina aquimarina]
MDEYEIRLATKDFVVNSVNEYIEVYISTYKDNIGFLLYYPLFAIEYRFKEETPNFERAENDRHALSWFLGELIKNKGINFELNFIFSSDDFEFFVCNILSKIKKLYFDFLLCEQIMDMNSIAKSQIEKLEDEKYKFTLALVEGGFRKEYLYFNGLANNERFKQENFIKSQAANRIVTKYKVHNKQSYMRIKRLLIDIDKELLELCYRCVNIDFNNLGGNAKSDIIRNVDEVKSLTAFFYYCSLVINYYYNIGKIIGSTNSLDLLFFQDSEWIVQKISKITGLTKNRVEKYLDYFSFKGEGSLLEFPLLFHKGKILFVSSSWMLNDFQFSIVNGHYYKKKVFNNRDKTISHSVVNDITTNLLKFSNIIFGKEVYYEFEYKGKMINSDIDVAIYDEKSNTFIIIECKWKDNHYMIAGEENYRKIQQSLNEIYNEQILKHKAFIDEDKRNLSFILEYKLQVEEIADDPEILYIAVDKRSQLYIDENILISSYGLQWLFSLHSEGDVLHLDEVIKHLRKQRTTATYLNIGEMKEIKINDQITIVTDEFYSF